MAPSPVIKTDIAARRLKVLFPRGVTPTSGLLDALSSALDNGEAVIDTSAAHIPVNMRAEILSRPVEVDVKNSFLRKHSNRDVLTEIAASPETLQSLKV